MNDHSLYKSVRIAAFAQTIDAVKEKSLDRAGSVYVTGVNSDNAFKITPSGVITEIIDSR